jgi:hypothetical protein
MPPKSVERSEALPSPSMLPQAPTPCAQNAGSGAKTAAVGEELAEPA